MGIGAILGGSLTAFIAACIADIFI